MVLGLTVAQFTVLHVVISMIAIFAGFIVVGGMFSNAGLAAWTAFFLLMTILTSITGFMFPFGGFTPAIAVGALSSLLQKVSFLTPLAPTGSEPPFLIAQIVNLVGFVLLGWMAVKAFQPRPKITA